MLEMFAMFGNVQPHLQPQFRERFTQFPPPLKRHTARCGGGYARRVGFESALERTLKDLQGTDGSLRTSKYPIVHVK